MMCVWAWFVHNECFVPDRSCVVSRDAFVQAGPASVSVPRPAC